VRLLVVSALVTLALAPAATADSIVYATDRVSTPVHVVELGIDGRGAHTISTSAALDRAADGRVATADEGTLRVAGHVVATVGWPIDEARFSPDGRRLAFTAVSLEHCGPGAMNCATWEMWLVNRDGTGLRELSPDGRYPRFSPDGLRLAFVGGYFPLDDGGTAVVESLATGKRTWLGFEDEDAPAWSPGSDRIAYRSHGRIAIATFEPRRIVTTTKASSAVFSPDGKSLAYLTTKGAVVGGKLVAPRARLCLWSPSGWLVYVAQTRSYPENEALYRVRPNGTRRSLLRAYAPETRFDWIALHGGALSFQTTRSRYAAATINSVDLATGSVRQLTHDLGQDMSPTVSFAGRLAYSKGSATRSGWPCLALGGRCLLDAETVDGVRDPVWSPDGRTLAAVWYRKNGERSLVVVDPAGGAVRTVTTFHGITANPSWSPDAKTLVVESSEPGSVPDYRLHLWAVDVASGATTQLATGQFGADPSWSPDGTVIAFVGGTWGGPNEIDLYYVATHTVRRLLELGAQPTSSRMAWSPDSTRMAYQALDGSLHVIGRDGTGDRQVLPWVLPGSALAWMSS